MTGKIIIPPFVECPDDIRCGQTVMMMILKHFIPERNWTFGEVDKLCGYIEGKWTWSEAAAVSLAEMGFDVTCFTDFDARKYLEDPNAYFVEKFGDEQAKIFIHYNDIDFSISMWKRYLANEKIKTVSRGWQKQNLKNLLNEGYLVMVWVDPVILRCQTKGNAGHFVLAFHYDEEDDLVTFHDGGTMCEELGTQTNAWKSAQIGIDHFLKAATDPGAEGGSSLTAFRLRK